MSIVSYRGIIEMDDPVIIASVLRELKSRIDEFNKNLDDLGGPIDRLIKVTSEKANDPQLSRNSFIQRISLLSNEIRSQYEVVRMAKKSEDSQNLLVSFIDANLQKQLMSDEVNIKSESFVEEEDEQPPLSIPAEEVYEAVPTGDENTSYEK